MSGPEKPQVSAHVFCNVGSEDVDEAMTHLRRLLVEWSGRWFQPNYFGARPILKIHLDEKPDPEEATPPLQRTMDQP